MTLSYWAGSLAGSFAQDLYAYSARDGAWLDLSRAAPWGTPPTPRLHAGMAISGGSLLLLGGGYMPVIYETTGSGQAPDHPRESRPAVGTMIAVLHFESCLHC